MTKKQILARLPILALVLTGFFTLAACPSPDDDGELKTAALENKIAEAEAERNITIVSTSDSAAPLGKYWVLQPVMDAFETAIDKAETALATATRQSALNSAVTALNAAIKTFKNARRPGTGAPVDTSALAAKIAEAENAKTAVVVSADASNVAQGMWWVYQAEMDAFDSAITAAKDARNAAASQAAVDSAATTLNAAITAFNAARQSGTKTGGFGPEELAALVETARAVKANVSVSASGDDVGPANSWVSQGALDNLNAAIAGAESASGSDVDSEYAALVAAINAFNTAKSTGTIPDKNNLYSALLSANSAKEGVAEAASAAQAPFGSYWATPAQWAAFNAAYNSALAVYGNGNASQAMVTEEVTKLTAAVSTFSAAVAANGSGMKQSNGITINGLGAHNGKMIEVFLLQTQDEFNTLFIEQPIPEVFGIGAIENGAATVALLYMKNNGNADVWIGTGSWYVGMMIFDMDNIEGDMSDVKFYISKSKVDFTANPSPVRTLNDFEQYVFASRLGDTFGDDVFNGGTMTLDALILLASNNEMNYAAMVQETGMSFYKDRARTQPFAGSDVVGADTVIYSLYPLGAGGNAEPQTSLNPPENLTADAIFSYTVSLSWDPVPGAYGYNVYRSDSYDGYYEFRGVAYDYGYGYGYIDECLDADTTYYYRVFAYDHNYDEGPPSSPFSVTTLPD